MKNFILFSVLSVLFFQSFGQNPKNSIEYRTHHSDLVVEGEVEKVESFFNKVDSVIYSTNTIIVRKVFKGNLAEDRIQVITLGGKVGKTVGYATHTDVFSVGNQGLFFCKVENPAKFSLSLAPTFPLYKITGIENGFIQFHRDKDNPAASDIYEKYPNIERNVYNKVILAARNPIIDKTTHKVESGNSLNAEFDPIAITYQFENVTISSDFTKITFDIYAKSSVNGVRFGSANLFVQYNPEVFGESIFSFQYVSVTKGTIINNADYGLLLSDQSEDKLKIDIKSNFTNPNNSFALTTIAEQLCHVELKIENIFALANIGFNSFDMKEETWFYDNSTHQYYKADRVNVEEPISVVEAQADQKGIVYSFSDFSISGDVEKYLDFDVNVRGSNDGTKVRSIMFVLNYSEDAFGGNIVGHGNISFHNGELFPNLQSYQLQYDDIENTKILFRYSAVGNSDLVELPNSDVKLGHIRMKISNCEAKTGISFDEEAMKNRSTYLNGGLIQDVVYSPNIASDSYDQYSCFEKAPIMFGFTPDIVAAGIYDEISISGANFGEIEGKILFQNEFGIFGEAYSEDIQEWSDSNIKVLVPSDLKFLPKNTAATGFVKVIRGDNSMETVSDDTLTVKYSVANVRENDIAYRVNLINSNSEGGYSFYFDTEFDSLGFIDCMKDALCNWNQHTKVNWKYAGIESFDSIKLNGKNQVIWGTDTLNRGGLTYITQSQNVCDEFWYVTDIDMFLFDLSFVSSSGTEYTNNFNCTVPIANTQYDIYSTFLHELGHAHVLKHALFKEKVMYPVSENGEIGRVLHSHDIEGGNDVITYSVNNIPADCDGYGSHKPKIICSTSSNETISGYLKIYPNPLSPQNEVIIEGLSSNFCTDIGVYDANGQPIYILIKNQTNNALSIKIPENISSGMYYVRVISENKIFTYKLIKI
jgi:hypothetical protein